jgi:anionic cell wall polymer biosynthesis LytR-Cps2A-Psr (LCP) family protein
MHPKVRRVYMPKIKLIAGLLVIAAGVVLAVRIAGVVGGFIRHTGLSPAATARLLFNTGVDLTQTDGRTNVVILGIAGGGFAGSDLTDTIIVLSVNTKKQSMGMMSVPRDIWSDTLKDKINSAYHYGEAKRDGGGLILSKAIISDVVGLPIHYGIVVDFTGFEDIIDLVGGIELTIPQSFTDTEFPIPGREDDPCDGDPTFACRFTSVHFDEGLQQMDGEQALTYVRSRHGEGGEGSDFARARRQQDVIFALREKLSDPGVWISFQRFAPLIEAFEKTVETDMNIGELATIGKFASRIPQTGIRRVTIEPLLMVPPVSWYGRYVLLPTESFSAIHEYIASQFQ